MKLVFWGTIILALSAFSESCFGDFIVTISNGANTTAIGNTVSATDVGALNYRDFTSPSPLTPPSAFPPGTQVNNDDFSGIGAANPNQVDLGLSVFALDAPIEVVFQTKLATSVPPPGDPDGAAEYFFTVNVANQLNLNGIDPGSAGMGIDSMRIELIRLSGPLTGADFDSPSFSPAPSATGAWGAMTWQSLSPTSLLFSGTPSILDDLPFGSTSPLTFSLDLPGGTTGDPASEFALRFTAGNSTAAVPEPMAFSFLTCAAFGWALREVRKDRARRAATNRA